MKKIIYTIFSLLLLFGFFGCGPISMDKETEVLSVNTQILRGEMIGSFLSSASGTLANDTIIVGLRVEFESHMFLVDVKLTHAELAHYKDKTKLSMRWEVHRFYSYIDGRLNGRKIIMIPLSSSLAKELQEEFKRAGGKKT